MRPSALARPTLVAATVLAVGSPALAWSWPPRVPARAEPPAGAVALASAPPQTVELWLPFTGIWGVVQGFDSDETHVGYAAYALDFVPAERITARTRATPEADRLSLLRPTDPGTRRRSGGVGS